MSLDNANDGAEGAGPDGYDGPPEAEAPPEAPPDAPWSGDDAQKAWEDHLDEGDPANTGDYGYEDTPRYAGPDASQTSPEATERWRQQKDAARKEKECAGKPEEYRGPCEAGARGEQFPMGDEPMRYNAPNTAIAV